MSTAERERAINIKVNVRQWERRKFFSSRPQTQFYYIISHKNCRLLRILKFFTPLFFRSHVNLMWIHKKYSIAIWKCDLMSIKIQRDFFRREVEVNKEAFEDWIKMRLIIWICNSWFNFYAVPLANSSLSSLF